MIYSTNSVSCQGIYPNVFEHPSWQLKVKQYRCCFRVMHNWKSGILSASSLVTEVNSSVRSLMYIKNNNGPKMEPWGTPASIWKQFEDCVLRATVWFLSLKNESASP